MNKSTLCALFVCCAVVAPTVRAQSVTPDSPSAQGYVAGRETGEAVSTVGAAALGAASGLVGGFSIPVVMFANGSRELFVGASVASIALFVGALRVGTDIPRDQEGRIQGRPVEFRHAFRRGYADEVRRRRAGPVQIAGAVGATIGGAMIWYVIRVLAND